MVAMLTHTPGPQVGLCKAHSGIKWSSSEKLEPRTPPCVNVPFVVCGRRIVWGGEVRPVRHQKKKRGKKKNVVVTII